MVQQRITIKKKLHITTFNNNEYEHTLLFHLLDYLRISLDNKLEELLINEGGVFIRKVICERLIFLKPFFKKSNIQ